jgi:hypothetical protein
MTVFGVMFERHGRGFPVMDGANLPGQALAGNPADPCNNVAYRVTAAAGRFSKPRWGIHLTHRSRQRARAEVDCTDVEH